MARRTSRSGKRCVISRSGTTRWSRMREAASAKLEARPPSMPQAAQRALQRACRPEGVVDRVEPAHQQLRAEWGAEVLGAGQPRDAGRAVLLVEDARGAAERGELHLEGVLGQRGDVHVRGQGPQRL